MSDSVTKYFENQERTITKASGDVTIKVNPMIHESPDRGKTVRSRPMAEPVRKDRYVQQVKDRFEQRSQVGINKYNVTLERDDLDILDWINHAQEEAMDLTLYLEVIKEKLKK